MNNRKSKLNEKRRTLNIEVGLVTALSLLLVAFNWNSNTPSVENLGVTMDIPIEDFQIQTTQPEEIKKPKLPKQKHVEIIEIIDNTEKEDDFKIETEFNPDEALKSTEIKMDEEPEFVEEIPFIKVPEQEAEFKGGLSALYAWLKSELIYPKNAKRNGIEGKVYVEFKIGASGEIYDIQIKRSPDELLSKEALRVVGRMPNWKPAEQGGRKVKTMVTIPINFFLR